jgi:hypothetical protein
MDSRLVAAAILHEGLADQFLFHTTNVYPNPDANTAALIRSHFGLRRGLNLLAPRRQPLSRFDEMCLTLARLNGLMEMYYHVPISDADAELDLVRLGGGLGALTREYYMTNPATAPLQGPIWAISNSSSLLTKQTIQFLKDQLRSIGTWLLKEGVAPEHLSAAYFMMSRNRYHCGPFWKAEVHSRFLPLYSLAAVKAAYALPDDERRANRVGFDLTKRFCPELLKLPLAEKSWSAVLMPNAPSPITYSSPSYFPVDEPSVSVLSAFAGRSETAMEKALAEQGLPRQIINFTATLADFHRCIAQPDYGSIGEAFSVDGVASFLGQSAAMFRDDRSVNWGNRLIAAYLWFNELELRYHR